MRTDRLKRREKEATGAGQPPVAQDAAFVAAYPFLWEYLAATMWSDGSKRETSTLLLLVEEGVWKGCLHDRDSNASGWKSGDTLGGLLEALEAALALDRMDWRRKQQAGGRRR